MALAFYSATFLGCAFLLYVSGGWVVRGLMRLSRVLHVREFVVAFFVMAAAASLPNLFVGVISALQGVPELSLGDIFGNNLIAMTLAVAAGVFFSARGYIEATGDITRTSVLFTAAAAVLPILLLADGVLSRIDGFILAGLFFFYARWLFSKRERFSRTYDGHHAPHALVARARLVLHSGIRVAAGVTLLLVATFGIVSSALFFAGYFNVPLVLIGLLAVGLGNALPEVYFSIVSARRHDTALIMGNLTGSVIIPATLVLGIVALIHPIRIESFEFLAGSRGFLFAAAALFFLFASTKHRIGRWEAAILVFLYAAFVAWAIGR